MVYAENIVQVETGSNAVFPPLKAVLFHKFPVVDRIAPKLSVGGETIWGHACHNGGIEFFVKKELCGCLPHVHTVVSNVNGHITDDDDAFFVTVFSQCLPLRVKFKLNPFPKTALVSKLCFLLSCLVDVFVLVGPVVPRAVVVVDFKSHKEGVVLNPTLVFADEFCVGNLFFSALLQKSGVGLAENVVSIAKQPAVVNSLCVVDILFQFIEGEKTFLMQNVKVNKIRIACN